MRKIINKKLYDTSAAKRIGSYSYGRCGDLDFVEETLYRKHTGELFLHGTGGPKSRYATRCSYNEWGGGEAILCVPDFDPERWVEEHLDADTYIELFGPVEE